MKVLLTGGLGFIGRGLVTTLLEQGHQLICLVRQRNADLAEQVEQLQIDDFSIISQPEILCSDITIKARKQLSEKLMTVDVVIHCAAMSQVNRHEKLEYKHSTIKQINEDFTIALAKLAAEANVERFIFLSSIKVYGDSNDGLMAFNELSTLNPKDFYGLSKKRAELALLDLSKNTQMETVIIRPPLVYGRGVKANFKFVMQLVNKLPVLPLGAIKNRRAFIAIDNLIDFILLCSDRKRSMQAANQTFVISDDEDISTTQLLRMIAQVQQKSIYLMPVPTSIMKFFANLVGMSAQAKSLFDDLAIDCSKAKQTLNWQPITSMQQQLTKMLEND